MVGIREAVRLERDTVLYEGGLRIHVTGLLIKNAAIRRNTNDLFDHPSQEGWAVMPSSVCINKVLEPSDSKSVLACKASSFESASKVI